MRGSEPASLGIVSSSMDERTGGDGSGGAISAGTHETCLLSCVRLRESEEEYRIPQREIYLEVTAASHGDKLLAPELIGHRAELHPAPAWYCHSSLPLLES